MNQSSILNMLSMTITDPHGYIKQAIGYMGLGTQRRILGIKT